MATPEGRVKDRVRKVLKAYERVYWFMPVQTGRGNRGLDFHCTVNGLSLYIETKAGNDDLTPKQQDTARQMRAAGATVLLVNDNPITLETLKTWMFEHTRLKPPST